MSAKLMVNECEIKNCERQKIKKVHLVREFNQTKLFIL